MPLRKTLIINLSNNAIEYIKKMAENYSCSIRRDNADFYLMYYLNFQAQAAALFKVANGLGIDASSKVVEIGSGIGTRCMLLNGIFQCDITGLEPHPKTYSALSNCISEMIMCNPHLFYIPLDRCGESTGLKSLEYDYILSYEVLEHVYDPKKVIMETYRLLKPGGKAFFSTCNYASFYEGHYRILWNPFASRAECKRRIVSLALNPDFMDELNFVTKRQLVSYVEEAGFSKISFNPVYPDVATPNISSCFPQGFALPLQLLGRPTFLQKVIQKHSIARILSLFDREYKLYVELVK